VNKNSYLWIFGLVIIGAVIVGLVVHNRHKAAPVNQAAVTQKPLIPGEKEVAHNNVSTIQVNKVVGGYLTDTAGHTLYIYSKDQAGKSSCNDTCAQKWPPYKPSASGSLPADWSAIKRADGSLQYAYKNKPLYYYSSDTRVGDGFGNGVGGFTFATP